MAYVQIPSVLRKFTQQQCEVVIEGETIRLILESLIAKYSPLRPYLIDDKGNINHFVSIFINDKDINQLDKVSSQVSASDTITIIPAMSGG